MSEGHEITRQEALAIAEAFLGAADHGIPGRRVSKVLAPHELSCRPAIYLVRDKLEDCWIAYVITPLRGLQSSSIVLVSRATGAVVYAGGANDEG
ncbi:MAG: hypothetical protein ACREXY_19915 [Gammaproteobacteria bacterium]